MLMGKREAAAMAAAAAVAVDVWAADAEGRWPKVEEVERRKQ